MVIRLSSQLGMTQLTARLMGAGLQHERNGEIVQGLEVVSALRPRSRAVEKTHGNMEMDDLLWPPKHCNVNSNIPVRCWP
jgi:hypothetical protein